MPKPTPEKSPEGGGGTMGRFEGGKKKPSKKKKRVVRQNLPGEGERVCRDKKYLLDLSEGKTGRTKALSVGGKSVITRKNFENSYHRWGGGGQKTRDL